MDFGNCSSCQSLYDTDDINSYFPESYVLNVGARACLRYSVVGAVTWGNWQKTGYLVLSDSDIVLGKTETAVSDAVNEALSTRGISPRIIVLLFSCAVGITGVDTAALVQRLEREYPGIAFVGVDNAGLSIGTDHGPLAILQVEIAKLFDTSLPQVPEMNLFGTKTPPAPEGEFYEVVQKCGVRRVHALGSAKTFDELRSQGAARWNLVLRPEGVHAAEYLAPRMDWRAAMPVFDFDAIRSEYDSLFEMLGASCDLESYERAARERVARVAAKCEGLAFAITPQASNRVFGMARFLVENGFHVTDVFYTKGRPGGVPSYDRDARGWVAGEPGITVHGVDTAAGVRTNGDSLQVDVAIGSDAAYYCSFSFLAPANADEGMFGYHAIVMLMDMIEKAVG